MLSDRFKLLTVIATLILADWAASFPHGSVHEQILVITREIQRSPEAELYLKRGELYYLHGDWTAALADYDSASTLDPGLAIVDLYRSTTMLAAGLFADGQQAVSRFLLKRPEHRQALLTHARIHVKLEDYTAAVASYDQFLRRQNTPSPAHYLERAQALAHAGPEHIETALAGIDEGLDKLGQIVTLQLYAIDLELKLKQVDAALERLEQISVQSARQEKWLFRKGEILKKGGRDHEARQAYDLALQSITALPKSRREAKATRELEARIRAALKL
jgi:tetratricopeptide (TPR) repeat protein